MLRTLLASIVISSCAVFTLIAQEVNLHKSINVDNGYFNHLDISASAGSTGLGIDVAAPIGDYVKMRAGFTYMPRFEMTSTFRVQVGDSLERKYDKHGNRIETKFDKLSGLLKSVTGYNVTDEVDMYVKPTYYNFRLILDVLPFQDKRWHFSAGFYVGPSEIGRAYNVTEAMPSLMAVSMYNMMYDKLQNGEPLASFGDQTFDLAPEILYPVLEKLDRYGRMGMHVGNHLYDGPQLKDGDGNPLLDENGKPKLAYHAGDPYMMVPDNEGMVKVYAKAKRFKPYVGFGYGGAISKDGRTELSFDAGVMFWGGVPHVYTHDGTDLVNDVEKIRGKVGRYVKLINKFPVMPVLEMRVTRRIF